MAKCNGQRNKGVLGEPLLLRFALIRRDTLCHVVPDIVVVVYVIAVVAAVRTEEGGSNLGFLIQHEGTQVLTGRSVCVVKFPVQR